jgi:hypothetical protein
MSEELLMNVPIYISKEYYRMWERVFLGYRDEGLEVELSERQKNRGDINSIDLGLRDDIQRCFEVGLRTLYTVCTDHPMPSKDTVRITQDGDETINRREKPGTEIAIELLRQIEKIDRECAFLLVRAVRQVLLDDSDELLLYFWDAVVRPAIPYTVNDYINEYEHP